MILISTAIIAAQPPTTPPSPLKPIEVNEKNADKFFENGKKAFEAEDYRNAMEYFNYAADMYMKLKLQNKFDEVLDWIKKTQLAMAEKGVEQGKTEIDERAYTKALTRFNNAKETYTFFKEAQKVQEVEELIKKAEGLEAKSREAYKAFFDGETALVTGKYDEAKENFTKARVMYQELGFQDMVSECDTYLAKIEKENVPQKTGLGLFSSLLFILIILILKGRSS
jgi:tetratricopeptide (TPR) repeat protein